MRFNVLPQVRARKRDVVIVIGHHHARDFLADAVRQTDNAEFLDVRRILVDLFDFVRIDVLAVGVDDDVFRSAHEIEIAVVIQAAEVAGIKPAIDQRLLRRLFIAEITDHHIGAARDYFSYAGRIRLGDPNLNPGQGLADGAGQHAILRTRHRQDRRRFGQSISFEDSEAQSLKITLHFFIQRRTATDEVTDAPAHAFVNRIEEELAKIQRRLVAQPRVEFDQQVSTLCHQLAAIVQTILDAAV